MPALQNFDHWSALQIWLRRNKHRVEDTPKCKEQAWFNKHGSNKKKMRIANWKIILKIRFRYFVLCVVYINIRKKVKRTLIIKQTLYFEIIVLFVYGLIKQNFLLIKIIRTSPPPAMNSLSVICKCHVKIFI